MKCFKRYRKSIYRRDVIDKCCIEFDKICSTEIQDDKEYWRIDFTDYGADGNDLVREFNNYLIALLNEGIGM